MPLITYPDFQKVDMRVGEIIEVSDFPEAKKPAYKLKIDFGPEIGVKSSSAQITDLYLKDELKNRLVIGVVNFPPKQIGPFVSETLTLGALDSAKRVALLGIAKDIPLGSRIF